MTQIQPLETKPFCCTENTGNNSLGGTITERLLFCEGGVGRESEDKDIENQNYI